MCRIHSPQDAVVATYYIETQGDLDRVAEELVVLETTAKWVARSEPTARYRQCTGEVLAVCPTGPGRGTISLLYPIENMDLETSAFPDLWLSMIGGPTFALASYEKSRLVDFSIPPAMMAKFAGPAFGIAGTRRLVGREDGELLIGTIVKPTAGLTPEEVADFAYQAALGGISFIKDDEKMMNPSYCPLARRVKLVSEALEEAEDRTGKKVLYAAHITTTPDRIVERGLEAIGNERHGADGQFLCRRLRLTGDIAASSRDQRPDLCPLWRPGGDGTGRWPGHLAFGDRENGAAIGRRLLSHRHVRELPRGHSRRYSRDARCGGRRLDFADADFARGVWRTEPAHDRRQRPRLGPKQLISRGNRNPNPRRRSAGRRGRIAGRR